MEDNKTKNFLLILLVGILVWYLFRAERKHALSMLALAKGGGDGAGAGTGSGNGLVPTPPCAGSPDAALNKTAKLDVSDPDHISPGGPILSGGGEAWISAVPSNASGYQREPYLSESGNSLL